MQKQSRYASLRASILTPTRRKWIVRRLQAACQRLNLSQLNTPLVSQIRNSANAITMSLDSLLKPIFEIIAEAAIDQRRLMRRLVGVHEAPE
jgi:hypothetical protein